MGKDSSVVKGLEEFRHHLRLMHTELAKRIVGQEDVIEQILAAVFSRGHCLLVGVPGLAKTAMVTAISEIMSLSFKRIQFTPDLMPSDITGTNVIDETQQGQRDFRFVPGPIFAHIVLADEINRTPPKTQAALLEAMQEHQVTSGGERFDLEQPFFVLATQNPIELEGTYPLPEAQLDRFMFNIVIGYLSAVDELAVALDTTGSDRQVLDTILDGEDILNIQQSIRKVFVPGNVGEYAVHLVRSSRPGEPEAPDFVNKWVGWGAGLRATQYLLLGGKVRAAFKGRYNVSIEDIRALAPSVLRHRILTNFYAESEGVDVEQVIERLLESVEEPRSALS